MAEHYNIVVMDSDYGYLKTLEKQIIRKFADRAEIQIITDSVYRDHYFNMIRNLDLLVTGQVFYGEYLQKHNISHILVLEDVQETDSEHTPVDAGISLPDDFEVTINLEELMAENHTVSNATAGNDTVSETVDTGDLERNIIAQMKAAANQAAGNESAEVQTDQERDTIPEEMSDVTRTLPDLSRYERADALSARVSEEKERSGDDSIAEESDEAPSIEYPENCVALSKFSTTREIIDVMEDMLEPSPMTQPVQDEASTGKTVKVISVYSPIGGCGKSLVALGISRKLKKLDQSVLMIGCDEMQTMVGVLESEETAEDSLAVQLRNPGNELYWTILQNIESEEIRYLLPFSRPLSAVGIYGKELSLLISVLKEKGDFDYLVLDLGSQLDPRTLALMKLSDGIVLITEPNTVSMKKMRKLVNNAALMPDCRCFLIANQHHMDGLRLSAQTLFGILNTYPDPTAALEDPVFYQIALAMLA